MANMSYEPWRSKAYDPDLRWRMIYQRKVLNYSPRLVSTNLGVSVSTVRRIERRFDTEGNVEKRRYPERYSGTALSQHEKFLVLALVIDHPGIYLHEICRELLETTSTDSSIATICRLLQKCRFTRTKIQAVALQQSEELRQRCRTEMELYEPDMLVFVDESGADRRDSLRKFGYSLRGKRTRAQKLVARGRHVSAICAMSLSGVLECQFENGSVNGETFRNFIEKSLLPHLMPFNGTNEHSVVVMDNAAIHHVEGISELIESVGALLIFLPPYSPDLDPIEEAFSSVKSANEAILQVSGDIESVLLAAFTNISADDCQAWFRDSGYY